MGTWSVPNTLKIAKQLVKLFEEPVLAGNATDKIYHIIGDDSLFDDIDDERFHRPDQDVRPIIGVHIESILKSIKTPAIWKVEWEPEAVDLLNKEIALKWGKDSNEYRKYKRNRDINRRSTRSKKSTKTKSKSKANSKTQITSKTKTISRRRTIK